ncbi:unnamed protein product, partial [Ectocarpus fasciculatus]
EAAPLDSHGAPDLPRPSVPRRAHHGTRCLNGADDHAAPLRPRLLPGHDRALQPPPAPTPGLQLPRPRPPRLPRGRFLLRTASVDSGVLCVPGAPAPRG